MTVPGVSIVGMLEVDSVLEICECADVVTSQSFFFLFLQGRES